MTPMTTKVYLLGNRMALERKRLQEEHLDGNDGRPHGNEERQPVPKAALLVRVEGAKTRRVVPWHKADSGKFEGFHDSSYPARDITFIAVTTIPVASSNALMRARVGVAAHDALQARGRICVKIVIGSCSESSACEA